MLVKCAPADDAFFAWDGQTDTCAVQTSDIRNDLLHCDTVLVNCTKLGLR